MRTLSYAGKSLSTFGVWWDNSRIFSKPSKLFESYSVPNRNGLLFSSLNKYDNIQIEYSCFIKDNFQKNYNDLIDYLTSFDTYEKLQNLAEPETYRMALFRADLSVETGQFLKDGRFTLVFDCKPQNYFTQGDNEVLLKVNAGNVWTDSGFTLDGINVTFSSHAYAIMGTKATTAAASHTSSIAIPSAGRWTIYVQIIRPDYQNGSRMRVMLGSQTARLNTTSRLQTTVTTQDAATYSFGIYADEGWTGGINSVVSVSMVKNFETTDLLNPSLKKSKPIFRYEEVSEDTAIYINGTKIFDYTAPDGVSDEDGDLYIDCELMDCYLLQPDGGVANYNPYVSLTDFPQLEKGINSMYSTNGSVYVQPKWWRL